MPAAHVTRGMHTVLLYSLCRWVLRAVTKSTELGTAVLEAETDFWFEFQASLLVWTEVKVCGHVEYQATNVSLTVIAGFLGKNCGVM